jgi:hypothetical protein
MLEVTNQFQYNGLIFKKDYILSFFIYLDILFYSKNLNQI